MHLSCLLHSFYGSEWILHCAGAAPWVARWALQLFCELVRTWMDSLNFNCRHQPRFPHVSKCPNCGSADAYKCRWVWGRWGSADKTVLSLDSASDSAALLTGVRFEQTTAPTRPTPSRYVSLLFHSRNICTGFLLSVDPLFFSLLFFQF